MWFINSQSSRVGALSVAFVTFAACTREPTEFRKSLPPPTLAATGITRVRISANGKPELEVSAVLRNPTSVHIQVGTGATCPLYERVFADPSGEFMVGPGAPGPCPASAFTLDLAPGDSAVLSDVIGADAIAAFQPGTYGINLGVVTSTGIIVFWAGAVRIPLTSAP